MIVSKFLLLLLIISCGKEVSISNSALERSASITEGDSSKVTTETAQLVKTTNYTQIIRGTRTYLVSGHSSYLALQFVGSLPVGSQISVRYRGEINGNEIALHTIERN